VPAWTPLIRDPTASASAPGVWPAVTRLSSGATTSRRPLMFASAQSRRSTTRTGADTFGVRPV
jgi:hypothetical protein